MEIAQGVEYVHRLNVVHRNIKAVRFPSQHICHTLTSFQTNILIDSGGHAHIAGLGAALFPSTMPGVDIDTFFHGAAPELVDPQHFGMSDSRATKASDMYAFAVVSWEVSLELVACP